MKFRLHTDYALRAMTYLAGKGTPATTDEIANYYNISSAHLGRVIRKLQTMGFMKAVRGRKGGVRLAKDPSVLTLGEVVCALEDNGTLMDGLKPNETSGAHNLRLGAVLRRSSGLFIAYLARTTFAELINEPLPNDDATTMDRPLVVAEKATSSTPTHVSPTPPVSVVRPQGVPTATVTGTSSPLNPLHR